MDSARLFPATWRERPHCADESMSSTDWFMHTLVLPARSSRAGLSARSCAGAIVCDLLVHELSRSAPQGLAE